MRTEEKIKFKKQSKKKSTYENCGKD